MGIESHLRGFLYLDEEKAASVYSRIFGGLIEGTQESSEQQRDRRRGIGMNMGPLKPEIGSSRGTRTSVIEWRVPVTESRGQLNCDVRTRRRSQQG